MNYFETINLKTSVTIAADVFLKKLSLDISCELSALTNRKKIGMSSATNIAWHFKG